MEETDGKGVNIVLNSLSGSAIYRSISILDHYGCFVEIGKTDIYENNTISLRPFAKNLSYFAVDIDKLLTQKPDLCGEVFRECLGLFKGGCPEAHPYKSFPLSRTADAFRFMAASKHIGKVVVANDLSVNGTELEIERLEDIKAVLKSDSTYIITGGFSGLGMAVAEWFVENGARSLVIISRSGAKNDDAKEALTRMRGAGAKVVEAKADITDSAAVKKVFDEMKKTMPPLRGIIHSAMVLDDGLFKDMTHERFMHAVRPKVLGAWNLHKLTEGTELDFFISFSSISGQYGTPGQANYAAANVFLDMLSCHRKAKGLAGSTISWGVIGKVGFVARNKAVSDILGSQGWVPFLPEQAMAVMEKVLMRRHDHRGAFEADWPAIAQYYPKDQTSHRFMHLLTSSSSDGEGGEGSLKDTLLQVPAEKRHDLLKVEVCERVARILGTSASKLDLEEPISNMGLDSLMANQLRNWIHLKLDVDFSMMKIMRGPSITELTNQLLAEMGTGGVESSGPQTDNRTEQEKWFSNIGTKEDAKLRLFCLPYMGGGASSFAQWNAALPGWIEVVPVRLPGREDRLDEEPITDIHELTDKLAEVMQPVLDKPFALYGHSIGAAMAYMLASKLEENYNKKPEHLFVAGWLAPHLKSRFDLIKDITEEQIMDESGLPTIFAHMRSLEISDDIINNTKLMNDLLPSIRADIILGKRLEKEGMDVKVSTPITAFAGLEDSVFTVDQVKEWGKVSGDFRFYEINGGHIFMRDGREPLLKHIHDLLEV